MALINAFIIFRRVLGDRTPGSAPSTHAHFMRLMQMSLLAVGMSGFEGDLSVRALTDTPNSLCRLDTDYRLTIRLYKFKVPYHTEQERKRVKEASTVRLKGLLIAATSKESIKNYLILC
ncbi:hypothetical protein L914_15605 [Phytophthora nicotianae]|uniref:Uncharacterized protein n=2 Tax=Phytophthora nicotianae TaxID=4792 RepID=V9EFM6_PHYNI|nr:hypothetical protein F443_16198 [Phytophthora nicotianae P1569]ETM37989.1 hypothetical protein L914_15605 [Phytophthora nicotianae]